jgi:hypothetical protein
MCVIHVVKCECDVKQIDIIIIIKQVRCVLVGRDEIAPEGLSELLHRSTPGKYIIYSSYQARFRF